MACFVVFLIGRAVAASNFGPRELVILVFAIIGVGMFMAPTYAVLRGGFFLLILTFGLGWRTIYLTPVLTVHPIEVIAYAVLGLRILQTSLRKTPLDLRIPTPILLLIGLVVAGTVVALLGSRRLDLVVQEAKNLLIIVPIYFLVQWFIQNRSDWEFTVNLLIFVITYVSLLGLLDFFAPGLSRAIANDPATPTYYDARSLIGVGFIRVGFIFYGNFLAGFFIFTFFPFTVHHFVHALGRSLWRTGFFIILMTIQLAGIYLSGYRGLWYASLVFVIVYTLLRRRATVLWLYAVITYPLAPITFRYRFLSLIDTTWADSSQYSRLARVQNAVSLMKQAPLFGVGWGGSGYVHSDLIQLGANLGIPGLLAFIFWWATLVAMPWHLIRRRDWVGNYAAVLFASMIALLVVLAGEGLFVFVQTIAPIWFLFVMNYKLYILAQHADET